MRAKVWQLSSSALRWLRCALAGPVRACARQRTALPIPWMGPSLAAGLGGSTRTARAAAREQVCSSAHMPHARCPLPAARGAHSVCQPSQVTICAPSGAIQTSLVALAQLRATLQMTCARFDAANGSPRSHARIEIGVRGVSSFACVVSFEPFLGPLWSQGLILEVFSSPQHIYITWFR